VINWFLGVFTFLAWLLPLLESRLARWRPQPLVRIPANGPETLPRLSIIVPARDEEATVEQAMRTLLALDYPDLEIIAVDDRSTDRTGAILDQLAAEDARLRVVHVRQLPPGWLGKNHALHVGSSQATGDYILFTDADVHFNPSAPRRAIRFAMTNGLDHLTLFPELELRGFWETLTVWFFSIAFSMKFRPWKVSNPHSKAHMGIGAFNLVRADAYRRAGGHASLPMDVTDDMKLGKRMKEGGGRSVVLSGVESVRVRWVVGLRGMIEGLTKNAFAGFGFRPLPALASLTAMLLMTTWPAIGLFVGPWGARLLCAGTLLLMLWTAVITRPAPRASPLYALAFPLAALLICYIVLRSMILTYQQGGILWRGTHYPLAELRKGIV